MFCRRVVRTSLILAFVLSAILAAVNASKASATAPSDAQKANVTAAQPKLGTINCRLYTKCDIKFDVSEKANFQEALLNSTNPKIFRFELPHLAAVKEHQNDTGADDVFIIEIVPVQVGRAKLLMITSRGEQIVLAEIVVIRPNRGIDKAFDIFLWVYCGLVSFIMGCLVNKDLIHMFLTSGRQKEVGLTFACQYVLMPLLAFGVIKVFTVKPFEALTLFIYGVCPSSFESAKWSEIFKGDVDLNKFASIVSNFFAIIMMPAWLYTLGSPLMEAAGYRLPISGLALNLTVLIFPAIVGYILTSFINDLRLIANIANKIVHSLIFIAIFITLILTSRLYAFKLGNPMFILIGPLIAFVGYILGATFAWLFGLSVPKIKAVCLHTGFQNVVFAFLVINWNFPSPEVDYIIVCLVPLFLQTSLPIKIIFLAKKISGCVKKRRQGKQERAAASGPIRIEVGAPEQQPFYENNQQ